MRSFRNSFLVELRRSHHQFWIWEILESFLFPSVRVSYIFLKTRKQECHTFVTLNEVFPIPGFRSVTHLFFDFCHSLYEIPDSITFLSSLEYLRLYDCTIKNLPESVKYLRRLKQLEVDEYKMLQSIPALPQSIQCFHAWNCESL
jgi:hypothetical protein